MWNKIMRIIFQSKSDEIKNEGKILLRQLDDEDGKLEAEKYIKKHDKTNWTSWD